VENRKIIDEFIEDVELRFNNCGHSVHPKGWSENKSHPDYDLWYVTDGEITIEYGGRKSVAGVGDIVFFNPGVVYSAFGGSGPCAHIFIHFDFPLGERFNFLNEFDLMGVTANRYFREEGEAFRNTFDAFLNKTPMSSLALKGYFLVLLAKLLAVPRDLPPGYTASLPQPKHFAKLKPVLQYIEEHIGENIPAELLAEMIGMSTKYFYAFFKTNIGLTPHHYITRIRMNRARELLLDPKLSIKEIAYRLGFSDPYTFSKIFKRLHRTSPSRYIDRT
jgi:AraC-like DNA-binding protein